MARGEITLAATGSGIPALTLTDFDDGGYSRAELGWSSVGGYSNNGVAQVIGPAYSTRYRWDLLFLYDEATALNLGAMLKWANADASRVLTLTDEIEYLDPEPTSHSRTLVANLNPVGYTGTWVYGFGVFTVRPIIEGPHRLPTGSINGGWANAISVAFQEV